MPSDGTRNTTSPGTRSGSRLVARIVSCGAAPRRVCASAAAAASTCSQLSMTSSSERGARKPATASARVCPGSARTSSAAATASGTRWASRERASSTSAAPSGCERLGGTGQLERQPRLAHAAGAGEGQHARPAQQRLQVGELAAAPDERARVRRQRRSLVGGARAEGGELGAELRGQLRELLAPVLRPFVVAVLRQQLAAVEGERRSIRGSRPGAASGDRRVLQQIDVDLRHEVEHAVLDLDRGRVQRTPRDVHRLVEVVRGGRRLAVLPEHVHRLLAMEAMARGEGEQLHQLARLLQPPRRRRDRDVIDGGGEAAQQGHADIGHRSEKYHRPDSAIQIAGTAGRPARICQAPCMQRVMLKSKITARRSPTATCTRSGP